MRQFSRWLVTSFAALSFAAVGSSATAAETETIDRMVTGTFGNYTQTYTPGGFGFMVFPFADYYVLNDGTSWDSGAGSQANYVANVQTVERENGMLQYTFAPPANGILYAGTDFSFGDHSAQGVLGVTGPLVLVAERGATTGVMSGWVTIISNDATYYDTFNYYSAAVGQSVYFETTYTLSDARFTRNLFDAAFTYNEAGFVDFTQVQAVPEPATAMSMALGLFAVVASRRRRRE